MEDNLVKLTQQTIQELCKAYDTIVLMRHEAQITKDGVTRLEQHIAPSLSALRGEIARLLKSLDAKHMTRVAESVMLTFDDTLVALLPDRADTPAFEIPNTHLNKLVEAGISTMELYLEKGLKPSRDTETYEEFMVVLFYQCIPDEAHDWRRVTRIFLQRSDHPLTTYLWYARECAGQLTRTLSVFLSELIVQCVREKPDHTRSTLRAAAIGSSTFDVACLLIAGADMPEASSLPNIPGPKVRGLLEACISHHGRLAMISAHGPLEAYVARGEVPDYTSNNAKAS